MKRALPILALTVLFVIVKCDLNESATSVSQKPYFYALLFANDSILDYSVSKYIYKPYIGCYAGVISSPKSDYDIQVRLNGSPSDSFVSMPYSMMIDPLACPVSFNMFYMPEINPFIGEKKCELVSEIGNVWGTVAIPPADAITSHHDEDSISLGEPLKITWEGNALNYYISLSTKYPNLVVADFFDTVVVGNVYEFSTKELVNDSALLGIRIILYGVNGFRITSGTRGNMNGDGIGFLYSMNRCNMAKHDIYLHVRQLSALRKTVASASNEERRIVRQKVEELMFKKLVKQLPINSL